jgi:hypothetical protein
MRTRTLLLLVALGAAATVAAAPAEVKVGDSWTFEGRNAYSFDTAPVAGYRVEVIGVTEAEIATRVTNLIDGTAGVEHFTRRWNPTSAERGAQQPFALALGYPDLLVRPLTGIAWHREALSGQGIANSPALQKFEFAPAYPEFPDRLEPGVTWRGDTVSRNMTTRGHVRMGVSGKVVGNTRIQVPAGEFDTIKLERTTYIADGTFRHSPTRVTDTEWFAPALGHSVKYETRWERYDQNSSYYPVLEPGDWIVYELASYKTR